MSVTTQTKHSFNFQGRSFLAFVLTPYAPLGDWLLSLEEWVKKSPDFFFSKPIILDLSSLSLSEAEFADFLRFMRNRKFRIISIEGVNPDWLEPELKPLTGGKPFQELQSALSERLGVGDNQEKTIPAPKNINSEKSLTIDNPVRSGQTIFFPEGDISITESVASGAEIIAGGSIHIYGTLRGRAFAGSGYNKKARIFCRRFEAELLVIGGYYKAPEDIDSNLFGKPVQAWLDGNSIKLKIME